MSTLRNDNTSSPYGSSGFLSRSLVSWLTPLLVVGAKKPLEVSDLPPLDPQFSSSHLYDMINGIWNSIPSDQKAKKWAYLRALLMAFGGKFYLAGALKFIGDLCGLASPLVLEYLLQNLGSPSRNINTGIALCFTIFALQMVNTLMVNNYFTLTTQTGLKIRTATSALVYAKSLRLSGKSRQKFSTGQIVNLMSTDTSRLDLATGYCQYIFSGVFQIIVIMILLYRLLGWSSFVGISFLIVFIPLQGRITTSLSKFRKETASTTDKRVRLTQEVIQGIRVIKFYAWEQSFLKKLFDYREIELQRIMKAISIRTASVALTATTAVFTCILTFIVYLLSGNVLTAKVVFPTLALFNLLKLPLMLLPMVISMTVDGAVSLKRIRKFLVADELDFHPETDKSSDFGLQVIDGEFAWESAQNDSPPTSTSNLLGSKGDSQKIALSNINITVKKGSLVAIVGSVGSGKSSLLNALVGELKAVNGKVIFGGSVAYCPQHAWIINGTARDNILFGSPFDEKRYEQVIQACALGPDFSILPDGDFTEIGEKGVNLSGGQKQRISLARAAYSQVEVVLLDDPLSAVDVHVGKHLMSKCINGLMSDRTVILVTHQLAILDQFDHIIVMNNGNITESGSFNRLMSQNGYFSNLMKTHGGVKDFVKEEAPNNRGRRIITEKGASEEVRPNSTPLSSGKKMTSAEERSVGEVAWSVYKDYIWACGGILFLLLSIGTLILWMTSRVFTDYWISLYTKSSFVDPKVFITVYVSLGVTQVIFSVVNGLAFSFGGVKASRTLHKKAANSILHAPVSFFDTNPTGRIINRFSKDLDTIDSTIPETLRSFCSTLGMALFSLLTIIYVKWIFVVPLIVLLLFYLYIQSFYRPSNREIKRLDALLRSPLYAQFSETLTGLPTIRAFSQNDRFIQINKSLLDNNNKAAFVQISITRWLGIRLESIGNVIILAAALCCYIFNVPPSLAGLAVSYALGATGVLNWCVRQAADTEAQIISSERIGFYANKVVQEPPHETPIWSYNAEWPQHGGIEFKNLTLTYRPELPPVLKNVTFSVKPGERIGIVGRTGAGKSSILQALFRIVESTEGSVVIDAMDTKNLGLDTLRSRISIIPQDPVVFAGTVRWNLDPTGEFNDKDLWFALERAHLKDSISRMEAGLDSIIHEGGENLSVGQRQLLCLARAVLRNNKILVLDEATANIDVATDSLIQESIRRDFTGCTILTIAHRLSTIIDYDRILVLDKGEVKEYGTPSELLGRPGSLFSSLVHETGDTNEIKLRELVK